MNGKVEKFLDLIDNNQFEEAKNLIKEITVYHDSEYCVQKVLKNDNSPKELISEVLEAFLNTREKRYQEHGYWVHSLSHFTSSLWHLELFDWIKKFNKVSFEGAIELGDPNCSDRLVRDFLGHAQWYDDPSDFHLTPENLSWMEWKYYQDAKKRIEAGSFSNELDYFVWKINQVEMFTDHSNRVNIKSINNAFNKIESLGGKVNKDEVLTDLLNTNIKNIEDKITNSTRDWQIDSYKKSIKKMKELLEEKRKDNSIEK